MENYDNKPSNCKFCGSEKLFKAGKSIKKGASYQRYQCKDCGRIFC